MRLKDMHRSLTGSACFFCSAINIFTFEAYILIKGIIN